MYLYVNAHAYILCASSFTLCSPHVLSDAPCTYIQYSVDYMFLIVFFVIAIVYFFDLGGLYGSGVLVMHVHVWLTLLQYQCIMSHSNWCHSLSKWMSVPSSHLDSSCPHNSSHSNPLSSVVPATRWFLPECNHIIWGFLHNHWPCTCHYVHSQSRHTDPTWLWVLLLHTYCDCYNS